MKKERIVIASILKPVDDTRMLEKMAATLEEDGGYEVFIIGYPGAESSSGPRGPRGARGTTLFPLKKFSRLSFHRLLVPLKVLQIIRQVKPEILIVNTHELLIVSCLNRIFFGTRIYYDIRENYYRNILYSEVFPKVLRPLLAGWVRAKEKLTAPFFSGFFLAEKGYQNEMTFFGNSATVLENKSQIISEMKEIQPRDHTLLLFSGTLGESSGVFEAIALATQLHAISGTISLHIIGSTKRPEILKKIQTLIAGKSWITLTGGAELVPHSSIVQAIHAADFGIICYPTNRHTENTIPTKLYEYLSCRLPILLQEYAPWTSLCKPFDACLPVDFSHPEPADLIHKMETSRFYCSPPLDVTWASEAPKLLAALKA